MSSRKLLPGVLAVGCVVVAVSTAGAAATGPDLKRIALTPSDFSSTGKIASSGYTKDSSFLLHYTRTLKGVSLGGTPLLEAQNEIGVARDTESAALYVAGFRAAMKSPAGRKVIAQEIQKDAGLPKGALKVTFGGVTSFGLGDDSLDAAMRMSIYGLNIPIRFEFVRIDRLVGSLFVIGAPTTKLSRSAAAPVIATLTSHIRNSLLPTNLTAPSINGTPQQGQTLTASNGSWSSFTSDPPAYTIEWDRCDTTGANCTPIPAATATTYTPTSDDSGSTLQIKVTATNDAGTSQPAQSPPSTVIN